MSDAEQEATTLPALTELPDGFRLLAEGKSVAQRHQGDGVFQPVEFPERVWQEENYELRYHVFTSENERVTVPAVSAIDALAKSGVESPFKIVRGMASEETVAAVIQEGRLVPVEPPGDAAEVSAGEEAETSDSEASDVEPGAEQDDDTAQPEEADTEAEPEE